MADATTNALIAHNKFGYGLAPDEAVTRDPRGWLKAQLGAYDPAPPALAVLPDRAAMLAIAQAMADTDDVKAARRDLYDANRNAIAARAGLVRDTETPFAERLVHFWSNHFAVSADKKVIVTLAPNFEFEAIRPHIAGSFFDLLLAAETHPAMLVYLDQAKSIGPDSPVGARRGAAQNRKAGLNENFAREIMELHTMGARSGYSQTDVTEFARALTGYTVVGLGGPKRGVTGDFLFYDPFHEPGARTVLGKSYAEAGVGQARAILADIARHPATAKFIARKLAVHFIADDPPAAAVDRIAAAFTRSNGDLKTVYGALIDDPAAWDPAARKFKSPWEWTASALRATGVDSLKPNQLTRTIERLGQKIWVPQSPAGFGDTAAAWLAPDALVGRADAAALIGGATPDQRDPRTLAEHAFQKRLDDASSSAIAAAGDKAQGIALFLMTPEFLWR